MPKAAAAKPAKKAATPKKAKGEKKEKKAKDPNAPKRAMGSYMWFCKDKRPEVVKAHPEMKVSDVAKELGALWKKMSDKDKKKYNDQAAKDKERYEKDMKGYKPS